MLVTGYIGNVQSWGSVVNFFGDAYGVLPPEELEQNESAPTLGMAVKCKITFLQSRKQSFRVSLDLEGGMEPEDMPPVEVRQPRPPRADASKLSALKKGDLLDAIVVAWKPYGARLRLDAEYRGITAVALKENVPLDMKLRRDDKIRCAVVDVNMEKRVVDVSLKRDLVDPDRKKTTRNRKKRKADGEPANMPEPPQERPIKKVLKVLRKKWRANPLGTS
eukprot:1159370-Amphidinium_carterae.1